MDLYSLCAPQLGEGLKDLRVVAFLKHPGDLVDKDEPVILVETAKATMEIESPVKGRIHELKVPLQTEIPIGGELIAIEKIYSKVLGPKLSTRPALSGRSARMTHPVYTDAPVSSRQQALITAMRHSQARVIPALIRGTLDFNMVQDLRKYMRMTKTDIPVPSATEIIGWCLLQAMRKTPRFRSMMDEDSQTLREYTEPAIAIAVDIEGDLSMVRLAGNECALFEEFVPLAKKKIAGAKTGANYEGLHSVALSDMSSFDVHAAVPVVVSPAAATLFIGYDVQNKTAEKNYTLSLAFDHRFINGVCAARFLGQIKQSLQDLVSTYPIKV